VLVLVIVAAAATIGAVRLRRPGRRQRALLLLCERAGVRFSALDPFDDTSFLPFRLFGRGDIRAFENVVWGGSDRRAVRVFDYWFEERDERGVGEKRT
jgi:hypothetical protein